MRADVIPQLADGAEVLERIDVPDDVSLSVLIPNERGLENALALRERFHEVNVFLSATESHNRANVNRSVEESLTGLERVLGRARSEGLRCEGVISVAFGCPYEGHVPPERVFEIARRLIAAGAVEIGFGDTTGMANPAQVREFFPAARAALGDDVELTAHFHNTRGQGLANVLAALDAGVRSFESSFGELGGCPVPRGATGNIATEDLVSMLHEMGVETGVSLERLLDAARAAQEVLGRPLGSHVLTAGRSYGTRPADHATARRPRRVVRRGAHRGRGRRGGARRRADPRRRLERGDRRRGRARHRGAHRHARRGARRRAADRGGGGGVGPAGGDVRGRGPAGLRVPVRHPRARSARRRSRTSAPTGRRSPRPSSPCASSTARPAASRT